MIRKVVIPAAGLGTRLLSVTKELPKEMLPIFYRNSNGDIYLKPILQVIFEQFYKEGFREFCFIVGRGKRAVEDHFTPDFSFLSLLRERGKEKIAEMMEEFYEMVQDSIIVWINQPEPLGFGHAVYLSKKFVRDEPFIVAAGDTVVLTKNESHIKRLINKHQKEGAIATLLLHEVEDPSVYGVAIVKDEKVIKVVEKPKEKISNLAILPIYVFEPIIFNSLEATHKGHGGEIQLTDAIQRLISWELKITYEILDKDSKCLDIGHPIFYYKSLIESFESSTWLK